jgi:zinc D-Ala-D-Ala carboxypeptidase
MTNLSPHFTLSEMTVTSTGLNNQPTPAHLANLKVAAAGMEKVRAALGKPILVNSAYRSAAVNRKVGGVPASAHCQGYAVDFRVSGMTPLEICRALVKAGIKFDQLIEEGTWTHISFDPRMRGQVLTMRNGKYFAGLRS